MKLSGWGRFPMIEASLESPRSEAEIKTKLSTGTIIARGNGRAYGDSAIGRDKTIDMRNFNHMLAFNQHDGILEVEAGVLLSEIIDTFLPRGWFPFVTPGTKFVTIGGMIASDVHGKNHHKEGSMRSCVNWIDLLNPNGEILRLSATQNAELFDWTMGGMGLTGVILRAQIRLKQVSTGWIKQKTIVANNLDEIINQFEINQSATYSVAWIDYLATGKSLGRSLLMLGEHADQAHLPKSLLEDQYCQNRTTRYYMSFVPPFKVLNKTTVNAFNALYFWAGKRTTGTKFIQWNKYFYPLDSFDKWNRLYGRNGFAQFQCVLPLKSSKYGLKRLLEKTGEARQGPFLAVLKRLGPQSGKFSFPMEGYTLAFDFPVTAATLDLMKKLDEITIEYGGRFYLAKDSRMSKKIFEESDSRVVDFRNMRQETATKKHFVSHQSDRLGL